MIGTIEFPGLLSLALAVNYLLAAVFIVRILMSYRTAQGAIAWIVSLALMPFVPLIVYALFGRNRLMGYMRARRAGDEEVNQLVERLHRREGPALGPPPPHCPELRVLTELVRLPFVTGNHCQLLIKGDAIFNALFEALESARDYILLDFYLVRSDRFGQQIKSALKAKLSEGVRVYFVYDEIGSVGLSRRYIRELTRAGAEVVPFGSANGRRRRFEINFRNHRKLLICDGRVGFLGGINLGDEYIGNPNSFGPWRDTHCRIEGNAVMAMQLAFVEDWYWATNEVPELHWQPTASTRADQSVLILPTGPADDFETCTLFFLNAINNARERIWIATPYFVPDLQIMNALQLASLRGVDVRVVIPKNPDHKVVRLAAFSYLAQAERAGISLYHYRPGFMHQKALLVDDRYAAIGTANLDNRSMRLNFEVMAVVADDAFVSDVETMLIDDMAKCDRLGVQDYRSRNPLFRIASRTARLLAPLL
ncbi:cardiolipin synthase [Marinobacteraceae bacterium S3BR75-40.1]